MFSHRRDHSPEAGIMPRATISILDSGLTLKGDLQGKGEVWIRGRLEGTIAVQGSVHIAERGEVAGEVQASEITIAGLVVGTLVASEKIEFHPTGSFNGHLWTPRLVVAEGARLNGTIHTEKPEAFPIAPQRLPQPV